MSDTPEKSPGGASRLRKTPPAVEQTQRPGLVPPAPTLTVSDAALLAALASTTSAVTVALLVIVVFPLIRTVTLISVVSLA